MLVIFRPLQLLYQMLCPLWDPNSVYMWIYLFARAFRNYRVIVILQAVFKQ